MVQTGTTTTPNKPIQRQMKEVLSIRLQQTAVNIVLLMDGGGGFFLWEMMGWKSLN